MGEFIMPWGTEQQKKESKSHSTCLLTVKVLVSSVAVLVMVNVRSWPEVIVPEQSPVVVVSNSISPESGLVSVIS